MLLALIYGRVTSTVRHPTIAGRRLLLGQALDADLKPYGDPQLIRSVIVTSDGRGLRELLGHDNSPARWYTIGLVDSLESVREHRRKARA